MAYATLAQFKTYKVISGSGEDTLIGEFLTRAQAMIDKWCGRTFEWPGAAVARTFDSSRDTDGLTLFLNDDLIAISSIVNGDGSTITSAQYSPVPTTAPYRRIRLLNSTGVIWRPTAAGDSEGAISITGKWAYSLTAPDPIIHATLRLAVWLYNQRVAGPEADRVVTSGDGAVMYPSRMPKDISEILYPYKAKVKL